MKTVLHYVVALVSMVSLGWGMDASASVGKKSNEVTSGMARKHTPKWELKPEMVCSPFLSDKRACGRALRRNKARHALLMTGGIAFGGSYLSATIATLSLSHDNRWVGLIPVVGPFLLAEQLLSIHNKSTTSLSEAILKATYSGLNSLIIASLIAVGVVQAASVVLFAIGLSMPTFKHPLAFRYGRHVTVAINPVIGPNMTGLSVSGTM